MKTQMISGVPAIPHKAPASEVHAHVSDGIADALKKGKLPPAMMVAAVEDRTWGVLMTTDEDLEDDDNWCEWMGSSERVITTLNAPYYHFVSCVAEAKAPCSDVNEALSEENLQALAVAVVTYEKGGEPLVTLHYFGRKDGEPVYLTSENKGADWRGHDTRVSVDIYKVEECAAPSDVVH